MCTVHYPTSFCFNDIPTWGERSIKDHGNDQIWKYFEMKFRLHLFKVWALQWLLWRSRRRSLRHVFKMAWCYHLCVSCRFSLITVLMRRGIARKLYSFQLSNTTKIKPPSRSILNYHPNCNSVPPVTAQKDKNSVILFCRVSPQYLNLTNYFEPVKR